MTEASAFVADSSEGREQPFYYSWNRRLRHLHGISLRNIDITPPNSRSRGKTVTEDDYSIQSPVAKLARDEHLYIHHSRSFDDLSKSDRAMKPRKALTSHEEASPLYRRPSKPRRRSTLQWGSAGPQLRQQKLEDVALNRLVDSWFSIHCDGIEEPVYISEVMEKSMNPSFSYFDLDHTSLKVTRSDKLKVKVWGKSARMDNYLLLVDLNVNLRSLQFIGKSLDNFHHPLPTNCVLFHLEDGVYTSFTDLPAEEIVEPGLRPGQQSLPMTNMASYDALMKLANLDECIQDALQTRERLEADINALLANNSTTRVRTEDVQARRESSIQVNTALTEQRKQVEQLKLQKTGLQESHNERQRVMSEAVQSQQKAQLIPTERERQSESLRKEIDKTSELAAGQIRRICEDLSRIYPIEPVKNRALQFTIRNIHLPNSVFDDTNRDEIAAALGYASHLVHHLALYLSVPLPYPISPNGSSSFIEDPVSISLAQRQFPLHPINVTYKFEYGVFLLNKDIEFLLNRHGLRVVDIRHTLPNLKYLLYVLTAGTAELPARKAGGIRGLWGGAVSPSISRRGSEESVQSRGSIETSNGDLVLSGREKSEGVYGVAAPGRVRGLPYRRSLLREVER